MEKKLQSKNSAPSGNQGSGTLPHTSLLFSQQLLDQLPCGVLFLKAYRHHKTIDFRYFVWNIAVEQLCVPENESFLGKSIWDFPWIFPQQYIPLFKEVFEKGNAFKDELSILCDGKQVFLEIECSRYPEGLMVTFNDVSVIKGFQKQVDLYEGSLLGPISLDLSESADVGGNNEKLVEKSIKLSLAYQKAEQAKKELENLNDLLKNELAVLSVELGRKDSLIKKLNKELDDFIYTASQNLKPPLLNMEGLLQSLFLEIKPKNTEAQHLINLLNLSLNKFATTLGDLSEIAQVHKEEKEKENIDLLAFFEDFKFTIYEEILKYGAIIETDFKQAPEVFFSGLNLRRILFILISNGLKYSSPLRRSELLVTSYKENGYTVLSVKDNGLGIKEEDTLRIFSAFKRIYSHVSGSGLGLFVLKRIVDNNEGKIAVESKINKGTTFKVFLKNGA